jgi:hypothetical protein
MADQTNETPQAASPAKKAAKKIRGEKATASRTDQQIDTELATLDREIKEHQLKLAKREMQKLDQTDAEKARKHAAAQASLRGEKFGERQTAAQCQHRLGGFGLEDIYNGDGIPAIVVTDLPIGGMRRVLCTRCPKVWDSPDPRLKKANPAEYLRQAEEWKEALQLIKQARIKAMGGPTFSFENQQGDPVHPTIL